MNSIVEPIIRQASDYVRVDTADLAKDTAYRLTIGCVVPRPIAWITTQDERGLVNAAPFSSYNYVATDPPMLAINIAHRAGDDKDTARNIVRSGEFVVNVANEANMELMHRSAAEHPPDISETELLGISLLPSVHVAPPRIAISPIQMECRIEHVLPLGHGTNVLYIGRVLAYHLAHDVYDGRSVDALKLRPVARLGGPYYSTLGEIHMRQMLQKTPG